MVIRLKSSINLGENSSVYIHTYIHKYILNKYDLIII